MADIYLYVPCNGTKYYTSPNVASSTFAIYGDTSLPSRKSDGRIYTNYTGKALIIQNDINSRLSWDYTLEWWQRNASSVSTNNSMMISAGSDNPKLQLHDRVSGSTLLKFENKFGSGTSTYNYEPAGTVAMVDNLSWTHIAYVLDSTNCKAYCFINGVPQASGTFTAHSADQLYMLCVGGKSSSLTSASEFFEGDLSDVILYNGVKYQENHGFTPPTSAPDTTGLIAYGQESYVAIPKVQLFSENGQLKIHKFGRGGKAMPAPKSYVRVFDKNYNILTSIEGDLDRVEKHQSAIQIVATTNLDTYIVNSPSYDYSIRKITSEDRTAFTSGSSILRTDGSVAAYLQGTTNIKRFDTATMTSVPTFKGIMINTSSTNVAAISTSGQLYKMESSNSYVPTLFSPTSSLTIDTTPTPNTSVDVLIIDSNLKQIYSVVLMDSSQSPVQLMSFSNSAVVGPGYIQSVITFAPFIADGKLYAAYRTDPNDAIIYSLLDDTQIWVDCISGSVGLALTSLGKLYTINHNMTYVPTIAQFGTDTGYTQLGGGAGNFLVLKDGDVYAVGYSYTTHSWSETRITYTGRYVAVAGGFLSEGGTGSSNYIGLAQEFIPNV